MVRTTLAAALAAGLLASAPARAQDIDWSGFYLGLEVGGASSNLDAAGVDTVQQVTNINPAGAQPLTVVPGTTVTLAAEGDESNFLYGGLLGFQGQSGGWVFGVEGSAEGPREFSGVAQTNAVPGTLLSPASTIIQSREAETDYGWAARVRIGAALGRTLVYAAGGLVGARVEVSAVNTYTIPAGTSPGGVVGPAIGPNVTSAQASRSMMGWTAGAGAEQDLGSFSIGLDVRYNDLGHKDFTFTNVAISRGGATTFPGAEGGTGSLVPPEQDPRSNPGTTRIGLSEWRIALRAVLRL